MLKVKKLFSLNPTKYVYINFDVAIDLYRNYCQDIADNEHEIVDESGEYNAQNVKSFKKWLLTEI
jgi:hypothetical protein